MGISAQPDRDLAPAHVRQIDISEDQVRQVLSSEVDPLQGARRHQHAITGARQNSLDHYATVVVILDIEYGSLCHAPLPLRPNNQSSSIVCASAILCSASF